MTARIAFLNHPDGVLYISRVSFREHTSKTTGPEPLGLGCNVLLPGASMLLAKLGLNDFEDGKGRYVFDLLSSRYCTSFTTTGRLYAGCKL
jgi:hypothetical protein